MNAFLDAAQRYLRGPAVSRVLRGFGIDPHRYWLLIDLFGELTDRREMFGHLGSDGVSLNMVAGLYFLLTALLAVFQVLLAVPVGTYFATFLGITAFLLLTVLLSETANSLVNPVEGLVLAHQPINGATYTAAKLTHLLRVLAYTVPALDLLPALGITTNDLEHLPNGQLRHSCNLEVTWYNDRYDNGKRKRYIRQINIELWQKIRDGASVLSLGGGGMLRVGFMSEGRLAELEMTFHPHERGGYGLAGKRIKLVGPSRMCRESRVPLSFEINGVHEH